VKLRSLVYGKPAGLQIDPIELEPMYHMVPGHKNLCVYTASCNFRCKHCQNWHISRATLEDGLLRNLSPEEGVARALGTGSRSISWTYNEPIIWHEYPLDMGTLARKKGLGTVYVTNGYITEEALADIAPMLEAFRVDLKAFSEEFYRKVCRAKLQPVLDASKKARELGMHIETVTLVIPGLNDTMEEMEGLIRWVVENLGPATPMHFSRFHPDYRMQDREPTPVTTLERICRKITDHADDLVLVHFGDRTRGDEMAVAQHGHAIGNLEDLLQAMRDVDDAHASVLSARISRTAAPTRAR
jgi:pyruvate formate lyase activating enzyme